MLRKGIHDINETFSPTDDDARLREAAQGQGVTGITHFAVQVSDATRSPIPPEETYDKDNKTVVRSNDQEQEQHAQTLHRVELSNRQNRLPKQHLEQLRLLSAA